MLVVVGDWEVAWLLRRTHQVPVGAAGKESEEARAAGKEVWGKSKECRSCRGGRVEGTRLF